jgi:probable rRNA maturation factor
VFFDPDEDDDSDEFCTPADAGGLPPVEVADRQNRLPIDPGEVIDLVRYALEVEERSGAVEVAFVDDAMIADLHERFLGVPGPTDVITFPHEDDLPGEDGFPSLGEIVVSTDTAVRQAPDYGSDPVAEAYLYVVHGVLHLLGWDDGEEDAADRMAVRQREILEEWLDGRSADED